LVGGVRRGASKKKSCHHIQTLTIADKRTIQNCLISAFKKKKTSEKEDSLKEEKKATKY